MKTPAEIQRVLAHCTGSEGYFHNPFMKRIGMVYTSGVKTMWEMCESYWLLEAIVSHQPKALRNAELKEFQSWKLNVNANGTGVLTCDDGNGNVIIRQRIPMTDFPLPEMTIWVENGCIDGENMILVMLLPNEH